MCLFFIFFVFMWLYPSLLTYLCLCVFCLFIFISYVLVILFDFRKFQIFTFKLNNHWLKIYPILSLHLKVRLNVGVNMTWHSNMFLLSVVAILSRTHVCTNHIIILRFKFEFTKQYMKQLNVCIFYNTDKKTRQNS